MLETRRNGNSGEPPQNGAAGGALTDTALARAAQRGDKKAFVEIVARHQAAVCGVAFGILADFAGSEDAGQEAFLTAWRKIGELREPERLRAWLCQIARNAALGQLRRRRGSEPMECALEVPEALAGPDEQAASEEEAVLVRESLAKLPEKYRVALALYYSEGQSVRLVAQSLEIGEDAVKQRLARGREMLREQMCGTIERVLKRTGPSAVFTMTIAAAIGALAAPAVVAGTVFAAGAAASVGTSTSILAVMSTTKNVAVAAAAVTIVCIPLGYNFAPAPESITAPPAPAAHVQPAPERHPPSFEGSALFAEWRQLHDKHGTNAAAMPVLYEVIEEFGDNFKKRAFHAALMAEWARVDPAGGLEFFLKQGTFRQQKDFFTEWLALDPHAAVTALLASRAKWERLGQDSLVEVARRAPGRVAEIASRLPAPDNIWHTGVRDSFAILAQGDFEGARLAAESVTGPNRAEAFAGFAHTWARSDLDAAIKWVRKLPEDIDRDEVIRGALLGKASVDPAAALDRVSEVPAGGRSGYFASTTAARVLQEASKANFEATVDWLAANPGRFTSDDVLGIAQAVTERLNSDPAGFLTQHSNKGTLGVVLPAVGSALLNGSAGHRPEVWAWLKEQPETPEVKQLKSEVLTSAAWQDPRLALRLVNELPRTSQGESQRADVARSLLNGDLHRFDYLMASAPEDFRPHLVKGAFSSLSARNLSDPESWVRRLDLLAGVEREQATANLARAWGEKAPEEASGWVRALPAGEFRDRAIHVTATSWAQQDPHGLASWLAAMPPNLDRDQYIAAMTSVIAEKHPLEAWQWAMNAGDGLYKMRAALRTAQLYAAHDLAAAQRLVDSSPLAPEQKTQIQNALIPHEQRPQR